MAGAKPGHDEGANRALTGAAYQGYNPKLAATSREC